MLALHTKHFHKMKITLKIVTKSLRNKSYWNFQNINNNPPLRYNYLMSKKYRNSNVVSFFLSSKNFCSSDEVFVEKFTYLWTLVGENSRIWSTCENSARKCVRWRKWYGERVAWKVGFISVYARISASFRSANSRESISRIYWESSFRARTGTLDEYVQE